MAYYWSSTCHFDSTYGSDTYDSDDTSGCSGHNDYARSKIKEAVDNYMTTNNMTNDLKRVDGYRIRLITIDELSTNLGWTAIDKYATDADNSNVPSWIYNSVYWTMTQDANNSTYVYRMGGRDGGKLSAYIVYGNVIGVGVRPVINIFKTAIPAQS